MSAQTAEWERIRSVVKRPIDFEPFWQRLLADLAHTPLEWERIPEPEMTTATLKVDVLKFESLDGTVAYAWLAIPKDVQTIGRNPGFVWLPGYSLGNPPPGPESLYSGCVTMGLNLHGNLPDTPYQHPRTLNKDYITQGIESPETYIFKPMVAHALRALDVLAAQPEVDAQKLFVGGMSQGGGIALVVAALSRRVRLCFADMPWLCDLDRAISLVDRERYKRVPNAVVPDSRIMIEEYAEANPRLRAQVFETYRYFDPLSHAEDIRCPVQISAGGRDPSCRPPTIYAVYNEIVSDKEMLFLPNAGHEIVPGMHTAHLEWIKSRL